MRVSWVIPCYQEAESLDRGLAALLSLPGEEILFVDDGSSDGTARRLDEARGRDARVRVVAHDRNRGVGAAMRTGFAAATGDAIVAYDADRTYPSGDATRLLAALEAGADVATATPFFEGGEASDVGLVRRTLSKGASLAYRLVLCGAARGTRTFTCGFRAYRAPAVKGLPFRDDGFPATAEILGLLLLSGARVVEVGSTLSTRREGRSKMRTARAILGHVRVLFRLLDARWSRKTPVTGA